MLPMLPAVLLTPMILAAEPVTPTSLAAEPVVLEVPEQTYDHRTQTSTFKGSADKRLKLAWTMTTTYENCRGGWDVLKRCRDADGD